jgi:transcriptional regulator with XRE-family HTH domain
MGLDPSTKRTLRRIGARIRAIRRQKGWTLEETEEHGWKSWRHLQKIEAGKNITVATLLAVAKLYKVHPSELFKDL